MFYVLKGVFHLNSECYEEIKIALKETLQSIEELKALEINEVKYQIEPIIAGDLKFLSIIYGINDAKSNHPCIWCTCNKDEFHDVKKIWSITDSLQGSRNIKDAKEKCKLNRNGLHFGYQREPITNIEFSNCVIDLLHLFLRITDVLFNLLLYDLFEVDGSDSTDLNLRPNLKSLIQFIESDCKIYNPFYLSKNKTFEPNLDKKQRMIVFSKINLVKLFPDVYNVKLKHDLWQEFIRIYIFIKEEFSTEDSEQNEKITELDQDLRGWLVLFLMCYRPNNITPYIHAFVYHIPEFLKLHKNINLFNLEGLEKLNHVTSLSYHRCNNKHFSDKSFLKQLIQKMNRMEFLRLGLDIDIENDHINESVETEEENDL